MPKRPWLDSYPRGVPAEIDPDTFDSLNELLDASFRRFSARIAVSNRGTALTFAQLERSSRAVAAYLQSLPGLSRGDRVAVMMPNLLQSPVVICAILRAGLTVVNVNPLYTRRELEHQLADSGARVAFVLENFAATLAAVVDKTAVESVVVTRVGDHFPLAKRVAVNFVVKRVKKLVPAYRLPEALAYRDVIEQGLRSEYRAPAVEGTDVAFLQYTGGTSGRAKGAMLTHRNLVSNVLQATAWVEPFFDIDQGEVVTALPLYHIFALTVNLLSFIRLGAHNVLITDPRNLSEFVRELKRIRLAFLTGVNTLFNALLNDSQFRRLDFGKLRICLGGGMAVQRDVADRWQALTGVVITQGYGLTEASPIVSANRIDAEAFNGSVGLPLPSTDVAIADDTGAWLDTNRVGEICVKGPQVMAGYWQKPDETEASFVADGWLRTGDVGRVDETGLLFIEDRKKDVIIVSGFNVYPNEVEDVVVSHPGVVEAAAIGVPDAQSGEAVKLFVVKQDPAVTAEDIIALCRENLTAYKIPSAVEFVDSLPKTHVGKVLRRALRG
jgi:long-chain acyl-CoA synthetase